MLLLVCAIVQSGLPSFEKWALPPVAADSWGMVIVADLPYFPNYPATCGDADHDSRRELYLRADPDPWPVCVLEHAGGNTFDTFRLTYGDAISECIGDIDRDGLTDLVMRQCWYSALAVYESPDSHSLPTTVVWAETLNNQPGYAAITDLDVDSAREITFDDEMHFRVAIYECVGDNRYARKAMLRTGSEGYNYPTQSLDMDGDGVPELAVGRDRGLLYLYESVGDDTFAFLDSIRLLSGTINCWTGKPVAAPDMDGNGRTEIIVSTYWWNQGLLVVSIIEAVADDSFAVIWADSMMVGDETSVALGNIDGDSTLEFAVATGRSVLLYRCVGLGRYECFWQCDSAAAVVALYDINSDGRDELIQDYWYGHRTLIWEWLPVGVEERVAEKLRQINIRPSVVRSRGVVQMSGMPPLAEAEVVDASGRVVNRPASGEWRPTYGVAGTFFIRIRLGNQSIVRKVLVVD